MTLSFFTTIFALQIQQTPRKLKHVDNRTKSTLNEWYSIALVLRRSNDHFLKCSRFDKSWTWLYLLKNLLRSYIKIWWNHYCNMFPDLIFKMDQLKPQCFKFTWILQMLQRGGVGHLSGGHPSHPACPDQSWRWRQISTCLEDYLSFPPSPPVASDLFCAFRKEVQIHLIYSFRLNCSTS